MRPFRGALCALAYTAGGRTRAGAYTARFQEEPTMRHTARDRRNRARKQKIKKKLRRAAKQAGKK